MAHPDLREVNVKAVEKTALPAWREGGWLPTSYHPPSGGLETADATHLRSASHL